MNLPDPAHIKVAFMNQYRDEHEGSLDGALDAYQWWLNPDVTCLVAQRMRATCRHPCEFCTKQVAR